MFGIGPAEFLVVAFLGMCVLVPLLVSVGVVVWALRSQRTPKSCPHCGKPLAAIVIAILSLASIAAAPQDHVPQVKIAKAYGAYGAHEYSLKHYDADLAAGTRDAQRMLAAGKIKQKDFDRTLKEHAALLRTKKYPREWSHHEKMKLYHKEVAELERKRIEHDKARTKLPAKEMAKLQDRFKDIQAAEKAK
jgi:hypothetical protein